MQARSADAGMYLYIYIPFIFHLACKLAAQMQVCINILGTYTGDAVVISVHMQVVQHVFDPPLPTWLVGPLISALAHQTSTLYTAPYVPHACAAWRVCAERKSPARWSEESEGGGGGGEGGRGV